MKIKSTNDEKLTWFNLEKYEATDSMSRNDWYSQLALRNRLLSSFDKGYFCFGDYKSETDNPYSIENSRKDATTLLENPIFHNLDSESNPTQNLSFRALTTLQAFYVYLSVRHLIESDHTVLNQLKNCYEQIEIEMAKNPDSMNFAINIASKLLSDLDLKRAIAPWLEEFVTPTNYFHFALDFDPSEIFSISMDASDEQIFEDIKKFRKKLREKDSKTTRNITPEEIKKWKKYRILPYLDLLIWQKLNEVELAHTVFAKLLYSDSTDFDPLDRFRHTTIKKAENILRERLPVLKKQLAENN